VGIRSMHWLQFSNTFQAWVASFPDHRDANHGWCFPQADSISDLATGFQLVYVLLMPINVARPDPFIQKKAQLTGTLTLYWSNFPEIEKKAKV
jgi:hypothetical protein